MVKKMLPWLIIVLVAISLIAVAAFILWEYVIKEPIPTNASAHARSSVEGEEPEKLSAEEISHLTVKIEKVTTNLSNLNTVIQISFAFQLSNEKAKEEFELLQHKASAAIIQTLADTTRDEVQGSKGQDALVAKLMNSINPILQEGVISKIDVTEFILSEL